MNRDKFFEKRTWDIASYHDLLLDYLEKHGQFGCRQWQYYSGFERGKERVMIVCGWFTEGAKYFCKISGKEITFFDQIIGFEALKSFDIEKELSKFDKETVKKVKLYNKAVWVDNDGVEFHDLGKGSSSTFKNKKSGEYKCSYKIETCDFVKFLNKFPKDKYQLYISMNIEGSEFCVLDKMLKIKVFENIDVHEFYLDNHINISGKEKELKKQVRENHKLLIKYFKRSRRRPASGCPEDFLYYN